jgi:hypothetical protein
MATLPTRILEIEFDAGVWTDVTADMVRIGTRRGRNRELGAFETGTMAFTLRNDGRKYDPDNTAGPYYGKLRPNRRCRLRTFFDPLTYPIFQGYLDRISQVYGGPNYATADFEASDLFKILNRVELPASVYRAEVDADNPDVWFPLDEPAGSPTVLDIVGRGNGTVRPDTTLGAAGLVVRDPGTAMATSTTVGTGVLVEALLNPATPLSGTGPFTITGWLAAGAQTPADDNATLFYQQGDLVSFVHVFVLGTTFGADAGKLRFRIGLVQIITSTISVADGSAHHWAAQRQADGTMKIFIDGVDRSSGTGSTTVSLTASNMTFGTALTGWQYAGSLQHIAIWKSALGSGRIAAHNTAGRTPWNGDLTGARLTRILDLAGVPTVDRATDAGSTTLQSSSLGGAALAYAQKVEETEAGRLFVAATGKLTFISRGNAVTGNYLTSQATLVDADSGAGVGYRTTSADVDEAAIVTRATVSREGSVAITYGDTAAQTEFQILDQTLDGLLHDSDAYSKAYAEWLVNTQKTPISRVGAVTLELTADPVNMYPQIFGLEIGDRVTYKRKPQNTGATISLEMRVEAVAHETGGGYWRTTLQLSPFDIAGAPVGVWDTSLWDQAVWGF